MKKVFDEGICPEDLNEMFADDGKCLAFLANLKWKDGFVCSKCGNTNYCAGSDPYSRRCTKCKTKETATSGTAFHGIKFPLCKAFYIAYTVCKGSEGVSSYEFGRRLSLRQMTCWNFKSKIEHVLTEMKTKKEKDSKSNGILRDVLKSHQKRNGC